MPIRVQTGSRRALAGGAAGVCHRLAGAAALALAVPCLADPVAVPFTSNSSIHSGAVARLWVGESRGVPGSLVFSASHPISPSFGQFTGAGGSMFGGFAAPTLPHGVPFRWSELLPPLLNERGAPLNDLLSTIRGSTPGFVVEGAHHTGVGDAFAGSVVIPLPPAAAIGAAGLIGVIVVQRRRLSR